MPKINMARRGLSVVALLAVIAIGPSALASTTAQQASGNGKTHLGMTFGFVAQSDLHGELDYINGDLNIHCQDIFRYHTFVSPKGYQDAGFASDNCYDLDGNQYRLWVDAQDGGEGVNAPPDRLTIRVRDLATDTRIITDRGPIQAGEIQVLM